MFKLKPALMALLMTISIPGAIHAGPLAWPIGCAPGVNCLGDRFYIGYPDTDGNGRGANCGTPGYAGHTGTDIVVSSVEKGMPVLAAADGEVLGVSGGRYDHCPNDLEPDCSSAQNSPSPGLQAVSSDPGPYCDPSEGCFSWGFDGGNFVLIRHRNQEEVFHTFYAHLRKGSIAVATGQQVKRGEKIAEAGSSGASLAPHLHFGVFRKRGGVNEAVDPWPGSCNPSHEASLWQYDPPYRADLFVAKAGTGEGIVTGANGEINCGSRCTTSSIPGTLLTLTAVPYYGSEFAGWSGACSGVTENCTVTADSAMSATALFRDTAPPAVRSFSLPPFSTALTVPFSSFTAADNIGVTGYLVTESPDAPPPGASGWSAFPPGGHTFSDSGAKTLYAWVRDAAGNVSPGTRARVTCIPVPTELAAAPAITPSATGRHAP